MKSSAGEYISRCEYSPHATDGKTDAREILLVNFEGAGLSNHLSLPLRFSPSDTDVTKSYSSLFFFKPF